MENTKQIVAKNNNSGEGVTETQKQEYIHQWISYIKPLYALCFNGNRELETKMAEAIDTLINNVEKVADAKEKAGCKFEGGK